MSIDAGGILRLVPRVLKSCVWLAAPTSHSTRPHERRCRTGGQARDGWPSCRTCHNQATRAAAGRRRPRCGMLQAPDHTAAACASLTSRGVDGTGRGSATASIVTSGLMLSGSCLLSCSMVPPSGRSRIAAMESCRTFDSSPQKRGTDRPRMRISGRPSCSASRLLGGGCRRGVWTP